MKSIFYLFMLLGTSAIFSSNKSVVLVEKYFGEITLSDSTQMVHTIQSFLHWYQKNYDEVQTFRLTFTNKSGQYQVDTTACNAYLKYLQSSGYLSEVYVGLWRDYFTSKAESFVQFPQFEGPPEGFDFDLIVLTQEPELLLNFIENLTFEIVASTKNKAVVLASGEWPYLFEMNKEGGRWLIEYISIREPE
ncbi:MAG: hypothetical protein WAT79_07595 [Saprospiraceae bacterium]